MQPNTKILIALIVIGLGLGGLVLLPSSGQATAVSNQNDQEVRTEPTIAVTRTTINADGMIVTKTEGGPPETEFIAGEVLVKFRTRADADALLYSQKINTNLSISSAPQLSRVFEQFGLSKAVQPFSFTHAAALREVFKLTADSLRNDPTKTKEFVAELRKQPQVEYAELNLIMRTQAAPNDPYYSSSGAWGQGFRDLWGLQKINSESAWNTSIGTNVVVAVSDSGVDYGHEDIAGNIWQNPGEIGTDSQSRDKKTNGVDDDNNGFIDDWRGWDFVTIDGTSADNDPMDDNGHGTHVAGTIAAVGNNSKGIVGVAFGARIMPVKGLNAAGFGSTEDLAKTILYAADNGAKVINASWGGFSREPAQTFIDAIAYAHDTKGVVFVAAAGNSNSDVGTQSSGFNPANIRNAITVSAFDHNDAKAPFSNFGQKIDVAAPGGGDTDSTNTIFIPANSILSLLSSGAPQSGIGSSGRLVIADKYLRIAGTSMAAPHVAGVAALIRALHPEFTPEQVRQALRLGSDDVATSGFDINSGHGRINASKALTIPAPLVAQLTGPVTTVSDTCSVDIRGIAAGAGLVNWRLEFGAGTNPTTWTQIITSTTQINNGILANWTTSTLAEGLYTLHLIAQNSAGQLFEDRLVINIDSAFITEPGLIGPFSLSSQAYRSGAAITIKGTAAGCVFASYKIKVRRASDGQLLTNPVITLTNGGLQKVSNNVLGTWDTAGLPADYYQIILEVSQTNGQIVEKSTRVIVDPTLHPGFPKDIGSDFGNLSVTDHLDAADVDGDGDKDLIIGYGDDVRIFDHTGNILSGWPQTIDPANKGVIIQKSPAVGDLDGDGKPEIVATNNDGQIFVWHANGTLLPGWPKSLGGLRHSITIDDINGDNVNEIVAVDYFSLKVLDKNGQSLPGWPRQLVFSSSIGLSPPCVADLDRDGKKEIITMNPSNGELYVLSSNAIVMTGWPKQIVTNGNRTYPALGDLNGDGKLDIVVPSQDGKVYAFNLDGTNVAGWPQLTNATVLNSPAIGDIDGDGKSEVVVGGDNRSQRVNFLYAWHGNGTLFPNWPVTNNELGNTFFGFGAPTIADVDGDGHADVIASSDSAGYTPLRGPSALKAYKYDGSKISGFPKLTIDIGADMTNAVAITDLDNDGLLEMAWIDIETNLYVWDLQSPASANLPWPMFHHDAQHTGTNPLSVGPIVPSSGCPLVTSLSALVTSTGDTITINGSGFSKTTSVKFSNNLSTPFNVFGDTLITTAVPAGAIGGPITISKAGCPDVQTANLAICPNSPPTLSVDNGSGSGAANYGPNAYYVNRLTPTSYPATLYQASIYFASFQNLPAGTPITVLVGTNPSGTAGIDNVNLQTFSASVLTLDQFNTYSLANPIRINSGDFVVGFTTAGGSSTFPIANSSNASANRSYYSFNGKNFSNVPVNFMIRGRVFTGECSATPTSQTITFPALANKIYGDPPFTISATATSGLPVSFSIVSGPATISGNTVTITGAGTITVRASQPGDGNFNAATPVDRTFTAGKANQTITFNALANKTYGDAPFAISATATSGLPVSFSIISGSATISGNTLTITGAGTITVRASQVGDANFNAATPVDRTFTVVKANQTITFNALANKTYGDAPFAISATTTSGLLVSFSIASGPATISGSSVTITGAGTITVRASQAGDANFNAATPVDRTFMVGKANQTITFNALGNKTYGDAPFAVSATTTSGLPVSFSIVSGPATISGNTISLIGVGGITVRASQAGDENYNAATSVDRSFIAEVGTFQPVVLTAGQAEIRTWTTGGRTYTYLKLLFPNAGYRVTNWGQATRVGNDFTADAAVEKFTGASVQAVTTTAQIYDLGPLANGTYNFNFKTSGTLAKTLQFTISSTVPPPNPIDDARLFVKQQYRDFLNREADQAGEDFWTDNITKCNDPARRPPGQTVEQCTLRQRETTSGAFFLSPEFQYTGYYVYRMYQGALGRQPKLSEFIVDAQFVGNGIIVNGQLSAAKINQNKAAFAQQFVNCVDATKYRCAEFKAIYDGLTNPQFVAKLFQTTGVNASATDRIDLVNSIGASQTRGSIVQKVVDGINVISEGNQQFTTTYGQAFYNSEFNRAFVQLEYFGYMKRDPDDLGYAFWLGKLNQFGGNFVNAEMVLAFISSPEYRARFGQP